jgi:hypothetical protein
MIMNGVYVSESTRREDKKPSYILRWDDNVIKFSNSIAVHL